MRKYLFVSLLSFLLPSCGGGSGDSVVGTWALTSIDADGEEITLSDFSVGEYLHFKSDGTFTDIQRNDEGTRILYGTWRLDDEQIRVEITQGTHSGTAFTYTILQQSSNEMKLPFRGMTVSLKRVPDNAINQYL